MYDPAPERPMTPQERSTSIIFLVLILAAFVAEVIYNYEPVKLSALLVVLFWVPLIAWHEAGHALMAAMVGWQVRQIVVGMGKLVGQFRIGSAVAEIRLVPVSGFVSSVPTNLFLPQLKDALVYFAGPGAELLLGALILFFVGPDRLFTRSDDYGIIILQSLAVASVSQAVINLIPTSSRKGDRVMVSDGLGIIRSFLLPDEYYAAMIEAAQSEPGA
jgi:hypothetical protein